MCFFTSNEPITAEPCGVRARDGRGRKFDGKMVKTLRPSTVDPFNAVEQENPSARTT